MASDKSPLVGQNGSSTGPIYHDSSTQARTIQMLFAGLVCVMVTVTVSLSIYRGVELGDYGRLYFLLGISLIGLVAVLLLMIFFIRRDDIPKEKTWFLYFVGFCVILEAIFTDVLLFR